MSRRVSSMRHNKKHKPGNAKSQVIKRAPCELTKGNMGKKHKDIPFSSGVDFRTLRAVMG